MKSKLYAMLPDAAVEWERRKVKAASMLPKAELCEDTKREISDYMEVNREMMKQYLSIYYNQRKPLSVVNGVAHIHINDYLGSNLTFIEQCMGASDYADISKELNQCISDESIKAVLLDVNSGGGEANGCDLVGKLVASVDDVKPVYAFTDSMCCSAAYAIACGASQVFSTSGAFVGSIGTIMTRYDISEMLEEDGVKATVFTNEGADLKGSMNHESKPSDSQVSYLQDLINTYGEQFQLHVLNHRQIKPEGFRGQALVGDASIAVGFVDGIATREEVVAALEGLASLS